MKANLRLLTLFFCILFSYSVNATDYLFTGNGQWTAAANWAGGIVPPNTIPAGSSVIVEGDLSISVSCTNCSQKIDNLGTLVIASGGTLTIENLVQFIQKGSLIVHGNLINRGSLEISAGSNLLVNGTLLNQKQINNLGIITVNNGGNIENQLTAILSCNAAASNIGSLIIKNGGFLINKNTAVLLPGQLTNNGTIENKSLITGNASISGNLENAASISPGNSAGTYTVAGNYTASANSTHNFEIGGIGSSAYDKLNVSGTVKLDGVLNVSLINGFIPNTDHDLPIITGNITGTFSSVFKPAKYIVVYNSNSVVLRYNVSLPMLYIKLDAKKEGSAVRLSWEIHNEASAIRYEVERSADGKSYQKIGTVNAVMVGKYSFTDSQPKDKNYYRIKVIDVGGIYRYSSVITLQQGKTAIALNAYPSPAQKEIMMQHASAIAGSQLMVTSMDGRILKLVTPQTGAQQTSIDLSSVKAGTYVMQFQNGSGRVETMLFAKQ
jgi:hypothetical protein